MDIVVEQIPAETPQADQEPDHTPVDHKPTDTQPQLQRETTGAVPEEAPVPKRRGRPPGSKNKPKIIEQIPEEPIVLNEPPPEPEPTPKKKSAAPRKPRAPKAQAPLGRGNAAAPPPTPQAPIPQTPLQIAASMLEILRLEQAERQHRRGEMYKSWVK